MKKSKNLKRIGAVMLSLVLAVTMIVTPSMFATKSVSADEENTKNAKSQKIFDNWTMAAQIADKTTNYLKNFVKFFNVFVGLCDKNNFFVELFFFYAKNLEFSFFLVNSTNCLNSISLVFFRNYGYNLIHIFYNRKEL